MQLKIERVIWNDIPEHQEIRIIGYIYVEDIMRIEESLKNRKYTELMMAGNELLTITEQVDIFKKRVDKFNKQYKIDERKEEQRRDLGLREDED